MKLMNFTMVNVIVDRQQQAINVQRIENVPINVEHVFLVLPEMIPSTIAGPGGTPVGKRAAKLVSGGGAAITVEGTPKQVIKKIKDTFGIEIAVAPEIEKMEEQPEPKPEPAPESADDEGPRTVKLVVPSRIEKEAKETPEEE